MPVYEFESTRIDDAKAFLQEAKSAGVIISNYYTRGTSTNGVEPESYALIVKSDSPKTDVQAVISASLSGTLRFNKEARKREVKRNTRNLQNIGVEFESSGLFLLASSETARELQTVYTFYQEPNHDPASTPYQVTSTSGDTIILDSTTKITTLIDALAARLTQIFGAEAQILAEIESANTQADLDGVTDSRT